MECDPALRLVNYPANDTLLTALDKYNLDLDHDVADPEQRYRQFRAIHAFVYRHIMPMVLTLGVVGGLLSLSVLVKWWKGGKRDGKGGVGGKGGIIGFMLLAVIDVLFCLFGLLECSLTPQASFYANGSTVSTVASYFLVYDRAIFNSLVFLAAWLVAVLCLKPSASLGRSWCAAIACSVAFLLPCLALFLEWRLDETECLGRTCYAVTSGPASYRSVYLGAWYLSFVALVVQLLRAVFWAVRSSAEQGDTSPLPRLATALQIVFVLLVGPALLVTFVLDTAFHAREWQELQHFYNLRVAILFFGWTQALVFTMKLPLYCAVSPEFRKALKIMLTSRHVKSGRGENYKYGVLT